MSYLCEKCKNNNNGWCKELRFNGLKKKDIQTCEKFDSTDTLVKIIKSKDGEDRDSITISVNNETAFIPVSVITDFLSNDTSVSIRISIPGDNQ